jgi:glycosyltransferase involved in cell wall biosynthesis
MHPGVSDRPAGALFLEVRSQATHDKPASSSSARISSALVVTPAPFGAGGLGGAVAEFAQGLEATGREWSYIGSPAAGPLRRAVASRPFRRAFGTASLRRLAARAARQAVPDGGWDLVYATPGSVPPERGDGVRVIHQATRCPAREWSALRRAERETGGRGDLSRAERRRREREIERADLIHVTSRAVRDEFLEAGVSPERLVFSYPGVDLEAFRPAAKEAGLTIAFVGPLSMRKGVDVAAELGSRLGDDAVLKAVGGPTCPWSRRIAAAAPFVSCGSVAEALGSAHVLVLPSRSDGFSFVVLEALASGTVPIVTPEVGASEIVSRLDGRLVVAREEFVEATLELLPRLDLADLSLRARRLAEEFDRRETSKATAAAVLSRAEGRLAR